MEKPGPHYPLAVVKAAIAKGGSRCFTGSALLGLQAMGLTTAEALAAIAALKGRPRKSMTTLHDHRIWQDVYDLPTSMGIAYVKFTLLDRAGEDDGPKVVISFKLKETE